MPGHRKGEQPKQGHSGFRLVWPLAALLTALALATAPTAFALGVPGRSSDPVVLAGSQVTPLIGSEPDSVVAFAWDGSWRQIPVQIDERKIIDYGTIRQFTGTGRTFQGVGYADPSTLAGADPDPTLDADDEVALMAFDAGRSAWGKPDPAGTVAGSRLPVRIEDPLAPTNERFIYLFRSKGGLQPSAGQNYVEYEFALRNGLSYPADYNFAGTAGSAPSPRNNPEDSRVTTDAYELDFESRWITDDMRIKLGGANAIDILDGDKTTVGLTSCGRNEDTFRNGGGGFIANIDGPVRAIRSYTGANSGNHTQRDHVLYRSRQEMTSFLRVHPGIDNLLTAFDFSSAAVGMTYSNSVNSGSFTIDGVPDSPIPGALDWEQVTGPQGSMVNVTRTTTDIPGISSTSFYLDQTNVLAPHSILCSGDAHAYGASGPLAQGTGAYNTDPTRAEIDGSVYRFEGTRTTIFGPPQGDSSPGLRASQIDNPLVASTGGAADRPKEPVGRARLGLSVRPGAARLRPGRALTIRLTMRNVGGSAATRTRICVSAPRRFLTGGRCLSMGRVGAGGVRYRSVKLRLRRSGSYPRKLRVKAVASAAAVSPARRTIVIRPMRSR
ncbi:MAG: hypothetical protein KDB57_07970 [Solirubrobacterales bacterium]|nr:hypothetical protein [Solirubrobacterales bacterium]